MIINVTREADEHTWKVAPTNDDGSKIKRNGNDVPWRPVHCTGGTTWDRVGELVASFNFDHETVVINYRDDNSLTARIARVGASR